ncbi:hypothetical protein [Actinomadura sp. HBU206391]|uniref:hypothetical protein n=1 Tax=Actinomadura sp. HBU206391 TaxID=2731692 RepID=UPI00164FE6C7|nr:hypothetical protein [Actinomadura sp. HBU206391]MBC6460988.1 hypothetical protein [Actinomadura sp. HBU206391]
MLLVATVVSALVMSSIPGGVTDHMRDAVCRVGGAECADPRSGAGGGPGAEPAGGPVGGSPDEPGAGPVSGADDRRDTESVYVAEEPPTDGGAAPEEPTDTYWSCGWVQEDCAFGQGVYRGSADIVTGTWDGATFVGCLVHICSHGAFKDGWSGIGSLFTTDPRDALKSMWDDSTKDIRQDWNNGHKRTAAGRAVPAVLGMAGGIGWFGRGTKLLRSLRVPHLPLKAQRAAETAADQAASAARAGDPDGARQAAAKADAEADEAESAAAENPTSESKTAAANARQAASEADGAVLYAVARMLAARTKTGKKALSIIDEYRVKVTVSKGGGTHFWAESNTIHLDTRQHDVNGWRVMELSHEALHALWVHTGRSASPKVRTMGREEWLDAMMWEEAEATSWQLETAYELRRLGVDTPAHPLRDVYWEAVRMAEKNGEDGTAAGIQALYVAHRSGKVRTSGSGERYPDAYGKRWDNANAQQGP